MEPKERRTNSPTGRYEVAPVGSASTVAHRAANLAGSAARGMSTMEASLQWNGPGTEVSPPYSRKGRAADPSGAVTVRPATTNGRRHPKFRWVCHTAPGPPACRTWWPLRRSRR